MTRNKEIKTITRIPYKPRESFWPYHKTSKRLRTVRAHRRFGKSTGFLNNLIRSATTDPEILAKERGLIYDVKKLKEWREIPRQFAYIAPFYNQSKTIAWDALKYYSSPIPNTKINESELRIDYPGGGRVRLFGADNIQSLRGQKNWEIVMDEFSDFDPLLWKDVISPTGIDTFAPITFGGTTKGADHFYDLCESVKDDPEWFSLYLPVGKTSVLSEDQLKQERKLIGEAAYLREYELLATAIEGAIFGNEIRWLEENDRLKKLELEESVLVDTYWDLGISDYTVVLFIQKIYQYIHIIDCLAVFGESMSEIAKQLKKKDYIYGTHHLPHDARNREQTSGTTREEVLRGLFPNVVTHNAPKIKEDALDAFRAEYKKFYVDDSTENMKTFIKALRGYRREFNAETRVWGKTPKHDWCSHYLDCLLLCAQDMRQYILQGVYPVSNSLYTNWDMPQERRGDITR